MSQLMARYCLTGSCTAIFPRGLRPRVLLLRVRSQANPTALPPYGQWVQGQISLSIAIIRTLPIICGAHQFHSFLPAVSGSKEKSQAGRNIFFIIFHYAIEESVYILFIALRLMQNPDRVMV